MGPENVPSRSLSQKGGACLERKKRQKHGSLAVVHIQ